MPYPLPLTRTEAYLAYKAGVIQQSDLKPSLAVPRNGIDAWLAYWTGLSTTYPVKNVGKNLFNKNACEQGALLTDGTIDKSYTDVVTSNYMPIVGGEKYKLSGFAGGWGVTGFYTSNKEFIARQSSESKVFTAPANAGYARIAILDSCTDTCQFEKGDAASGYEAYTGEPLILQEEEAYIAYLCGVINEYPEKCLRRVGAYLRYLISARWGRPDHPLNREELYLSLIKTQFIPSGDPSSDIEIDGTAKAPFVDVKMYGDTFQQSYEGKNLLNINASIMEQDRNGIKITYEQETGIITINGTCTTDNTTFGFFASADESRHITVNGDVTVSCFYVSGSITNATADTKIQVQNNTYGNAIYIGLTNSDAHTTANKNDTYNRNNIRIDSGVVFDNYKIKVMIEQSATATAYEPYVGGQPSPSPDYPEPIQTVTGLQTVEVKGKNLVDSSQLFIAAGGGGVKITKETDGSFTINGRSTDRYNNYRYDATEIFSQLVGETVTISVETTGTGAWANFGLKASADLLIANPATNPRTGVVPESTRYLVDFYFINGVTFDNFNVKLQIEKGSTATAYTPYSKQAYSINLGKNLLSAGLEVGGWLIGVGSTIEKTTNNKAYRCNAPIAVEPNTEYIFSINGEAFDSFRVVYANSAGTILSNEVFAGTIKTPDNCSQIVFYSSAMKSAYPNIEDIKAQLEAGSTVTPYAEYFTPIELCKLDTYQDYIWKDGESWKVHKAISKYVLNGNQDERWLITGNCFRPDGAVFDDKIYDPVTTDAKSNLLTVWKNTPGSITSSMPDLRFGWAATGTKKLAVRFDKIRQGKSVSEALESWTSLISETPMLIYFEALAASDTTITDANLIAQLEAIRTALLENDANTITNTATGTNLAGDMEVGYYGYTPSSQYDKWVWLNAGAAGAHYEQI